jgi:heptosyltransferase-2
MEYDAQMSVTGSPSKPYQILIIGPSWVGDMVMAQSLFIALHRRYGAATRIDVLAPAWSLPILERMPEVRQGLVMPLGHGKLDLKTRYQLGKSLRGQGYDQAIVLPNSLKSAFVPLFAKIPKRTGWLGELRYGWLNDHRKLDKDAFPLMIDRFVALAYDKASLSCAADFSHPHPYPAFSVQAGNVKQARLAFDLPDDRPVLALCPGAEFGESKRWPERQYAEVAERALAAGWQVWLFGSANDDQVCSSIRAQVSASHQPQCLNLAGKTALSQAVDLLSAADLVIANDSGLMHVAAALQRPLVVVYGSTSPKFTPPLSENVEIVSLDLDCAPCFERECPLGHSDCMKKLPSATVLSALARLRSKQPLAWAANSADFVIAAGEAG